MASGAEETKNRGRLPSGLIGYVSSYCKTVNLFSYDFEKVQVVTIYLYLGCRMGWQKYTYNFDLLTIICQSMCHNMAELIFGLAESKCE